MENKLARQLLQLARLYYVEPSYRDAGGIRRQADPHTLLAALRALDAPVISLEDVPQALRQRRLALWQRICAPVVVAWNGRPASLQLRLPADQAESTVDCSLELEQGGVQHWSYRLASLPALRAAVVEGVGYQVRELPLPADLPWGYHQLQLSLPGMLVKSVVIAAPLHAYVPPSTSLNRLWGVFLPLYALHSRQSWGAGNYSDLASLAEWVQAMNGDLVGTLPLLAAFLDEPFEPSPYSPASRLFWNEFYLDITRIPELEFCQPARELLASPALQLEIAELRLAPQVDYRQGMAVKRRVLELLAHHCRTASPDRRGALERWVAANPAVSDYACFRAATERQRTGWPAWPAPMREGTLREGDFDPEAVYYHLYVQWQSEAQLTTAAAAARQRGVSLYLDLPLGVHGAGFDTWRYRAAFAQEASCGAPPDLFNPQGQDWGFPPLHPERIREQSYHYYIASLRHHLRCAGLLRLDHIIGLHHLYWVPRGFSASQGVFVRYQAAELYAILILESHRHQAMLIGEDLGTVPAYIRSTMARHHIAGMHVLPFELRPGSDQGPNAVPAGALACINTHDMPPFAGHWQQQTTEDRDSLIAWLHRHGWLRSPTSIPGLVHQACLNYLAASPARVLLVNLEDLWMETVPQNVPGTVAASNWQRKARYSLEIFSNMPSMIAILKALHHLRREE